MTDKHRIFVGQLCDKSSNNAQVLNTRALLARFTNPAIEWIAPYYRKPDPALVDRKNITLVKLWRTRLWQFHKFLLYQMNVDAIFYPNVYWFDDLALQLRKLSDRRVPVISTLEGLVGNETRERQLSEWAGHAVYCQHIPDSLLRRIDRVHGEADHIIAISPFLAKMGRLLYGDKISVLPLGIETSCFNYRNTLHIKQRFRVIGVGGCNYRKHPELFLALGKLFPQADFIWIGEGESRHELLLEKERSGIENVSFPGPLSNNRLPDEFRKANLFVLPSHSEGVPKVTQEAAACGLPAIIYGFYEAPTVIDGKNGYVVWDNEQLFKRVGELIADPAKAQLMGETSAQMALASDWNNIAPLWENCLLGVLVDQSKWRDSAA